MADKALLDAFLAGNPDPLGAARYALACGANPNTPLRSPAGWLTPLAAAQTLPCSQQMAAILLAAGACPNQASPSGQLPLHMAARSLDIDFSKLMIQAGADASLVNGDGLSVELCAKLTIDDVSPRTFLASLMALSTPTDEQREQVQKIAAFMAQIEAASINAATGPAPMAKKKSARL